MTSREIPDSKGSSRTISHWTGSHFEKDLRDAQRMIKKLKLEKEEYEIYKKKMEEEAEERMRSYLRRSDIQETKINNLELELRRLRGEPITKSPREKDDPEKSQVNWEEVYDESLTGRSMPGVRVLFDKLCEEVGTTLEEKKTLEKQKGALEESTLDKRRALAKMTVERERERASWIRRISVLEESIQKIKSEAALLDSTNNKLATENRSLRNEVLLTGGAELRELYEKTKRELTRMKRRNHELEEDQARAAEREVELNGRIATLEGLLDRNKYKSPTTGLTVQTPSTATRRTRTPPKQTPSPSPPSIRSPTISTPSPFDAGLIDTSEVDRIVQGLLSEENEAKREWSEQKVN